MVRGACYTAYAIPHRRGSAQADATRDAGSMWMPSYVPFMKCHGDVTYHRAPSLAAASRTFSSTSTSM